jgi:cytochrome P450
MINRWEAGQSFDVDREMNALTMSIIAKTLFDADISGEAREIGTVIADALHLVNRRLDKIFALPDWVPTAENRRMAQVVRRMDEIIQRFIDERRKTGEDKGDLLSMLLLAQDEDSGQMNDKQVRDEAMTLFGAGHETTAVALTWTWYLLSQYPEVEARLHQELETVLGGRNPTLDDLPRLPYTEMIVKETLRLYPPAFALTRDTIADTEIGGYLVSKGRPVMINLYGVQRDARFFPDPDRFDPERFSPENEKHIPKYAYLPFGGGPRVCIGNAFAMMEARLVLATVAQHYRLAVAPGHQVIPERMFTLRPKYGMKMIATKREPVLEMA